MVPLDKYEQHIPKTYVKSNYTDRYLLIPKNSKNLCAAINNSPNNMVNIIKENILPKTIVHYDTVYQEVSDFLEIVLKYVDVDFTVLGYGLTVKGSSGDENLGLNICVLASAGSALSELTIWGRATVSFRF